MNQANIANIARVTHLSRPQTQVESEVGNLQNANKALIERCQALRHRLGSVLRTDAAKLTETEKPHEMLLVPLAEELREIGKTTATAINILEDISNCIELPFIE